jgi:hypothetical protein
MLRCGRGAPPPLTAEAQHIRSAWAPTVVLSVATAPVVNTAAAPSTAPPAPSGVNHPRAPRQPRLVAARRRSAPASPLRRPGP